MASAGKVDVKVAVKPKVSVGTSTVAGGTVTIAAYALAIIAFIQGARDEATISAVVVGTVSLVSVLAGRYGQAIAALLPIALSQARATPPAVSFGSSTTSPGSGTNVTWTSPRPGAAVLNEIAAPRDEPGDPDALPDYTTEEHPPPDVGDEHARPDDGDQP